MTLKEALQAAKNLISSQASWTRGVLARDVFGHSVDPRSAEATCFCALGALCKVTAFDVATRLIAIDVLHSVLGDAIDVAALNDHHGHAATLEMFDRAIAVAT